MPANMTVHTCALVRDEATVDLNDNERKTFVPCSAKAVARCSTSESLARDGGLTDPWARTALHEQVRGMSGALSTRPHIRAPLPKCDGYLIETKADNRFRPLSLCLQRQF